jgi:3-hydroxyacyl-CoA dehydrogenase/enoyl-CoA hydratase/3-hydroxybutyryl-CoA epimerase
MLNEAVTCWQEKTVADADLLDAGMIFGTGFAPFRGGPLNYAKHRGVQEIVERLDTLQAKYGERFKPAPAWQAFRSNSAAGTPKIKSDAPVEQRSVN